MELEKTPEAMKSFRDQTANVKAIQPSGKTVDPFEDDTPLACGLENPELNTTI